jgi:ribonuclease-3
MPMKLEDLEKKIGHTFKDKALLEKALTHSSCAYETQGDKGSDNELLEFLGDSVVGLAAADFFYSAYPDLTEGELSKFKSTATSTLSLSELARKLKLDKAILLGRGEEKSGGRKKKTILADVFEAVVGAVYIDGGFETAKAFISRLLSSSFKPIRREFFINNYKSALQEMFQKSDLLSPTYETLTEKGPAHQKTFVVEVRLGNRPLAKAKGRSKKIAEQQAARKALKSILGRKMKVLTPESFIIEKKP